MKLTYSSATALGAAGGGSFLLNESQESTSLVLSAFCLCLQSFGSHSVSDTRAEGTAKSLLWFLNNSAPPALGEAIGHRTVLLGVPAGSDWNGWERVSLIGGAQLQSEPRLSAARTTFEHGAAALIPV